MKKQRSVRVVESDLAPPALPIRQQQAPARPESVKHLLVLAESLDQVPPGIATPGAYLYKVACNRVRNLFRSTTTTASMDTALSDREHFTLHDVLAAVGIWQRFDQNWAI
jgi:hypothetical protein